MTPEPRAGISDATEEAALFAAAERHAAAGEMAAAENCFRDLLGRSPRHLAALQGLAALLAADGRSAAAKEFAAVARDVEVENLEAVGTALLHHQQIDKAIGCFERALVLNPRAIRTHWLLAEARYGQGRKDAALECYQRCLELDPGNAGTAFMVAALGGAAAPIRAPDDFIAPHFDHYAETFDDHLIGDLRYRAHELVAAAAQDALVAGRRSLDVLDLGCGTGLCGALIGAAGIAGCLHGVDLSPAMLEKAAARDIYDRLDEAEIGAHLGALDRAYDVILAADVLVYLGDFESLFAGVFEALRPGGLFAFSVERAVGPADGGAEAPGYTLGPAGRYLHHPAYIAAVASAAGFVEVSGAAATLRLEYGVPVAGHIAVLGRG